MKQIGRWIGLAAVLVMVGTPVVGQQLAPDTLRFQVGSTGVVQMTSPKAGRYVVQLRDSASRLLDRVIVYIVAPPPPVATIPGTVGDLGVVGVNDTAAILQFTDVSDGAGGVASYDVRQAVGTLDWGSAASIAAGTCATPVLGISVGTVHACSVTGLSPGTAYQWRLVAFRGTLNTATTVFGGLSNVASASTTAGAPLPPQPPPPLPPPPPPLGGNVLFASDWSSGLGATDTAIRDGGRWTQWSDWGGAGLLTVVAGGPPGYATALRVQQRGPNYAARVEKDGFGSVSTDYYVRFYMRNDDTSPVEDHIVSTIAPPDQADLIYLTKTGGSSWSFRVRAWSGGFIYPISSWGLNKQLVNGQWYRIEYWVHFVAANRVQIHPRISDATGALVATDADFRQEDYGSATWNGRSDWTLANFAAAGNSIGLADPSRLTSFSMGNNGQANASDTGRYWYYAGVRICTGTWCGQ